MQWLCLRTGTRATPMAGFVYYRFYLQLGHPGPSVAVLFPCRISGGTPEARGRCIMNDMQRRRPLNSGLAGKLLALILAVPVLLIVLLLVLIF